jgi:PAP2 superfamily
MSEVLDSGYRNRFDSGYRVTPRDSGYRGHRSDEYIETAAATKLAMRKGPGGALSLDAPNNDSVSVGQLPKRMWRWSADVRTTLLVSDVLRLLNIVADSKERRVRLLARSGNEFRTLAVIEKPKHAVFLDELKDVVSRVDQRPDVLDEVMSQALGTTNCWTTVFPWLDDIGFASETLFITVSRVASALTQEAKDALGCFRPHEISAQVCPMIDVPGHSSLPMGHAVQAYAMARLIDRLLHVDCSKDAGRTSIVHRAYWLARAISENRITAGLHFPTDLRMGAGLGFVVADSVVAIANGSAFDAKARNCDAADSLGSVDSGNSPQLGDANFQHDGESMKLTLPRPPRLESLLGLAEAEWATLRPKKNEV